MPYIASNNGLTVQWLDTAPSPPAAGQVAFAAWPTPAQLAAAFPGYAAAQAQAQAPAQFAAAQAAGLTVACTVTPALSATWGCQTQDEIAWIAVQDAINANQGWPGFMLDINGAKHALTAAQATAIADALLQYLAAWDAWVAGGGQGAQPATSTTLAI